MTKTNETTPENTKCGFVAMVGAPNAGKSTLTNALVGQHVSIVSSKVQTTRFPVKGIFIEGNSQVILVDTPGIFSPKKDVGLDRAMVQSALQSAADADIILFIVDAAVASKSIEWCLPDLLDLTGRRVSLILNKVDCVDRKILLELSEKINQRYDFEDTYMISATKKQGLDILVKNIAAKMPGSPFLFPEDQISDLPMKLYAAERTREAAFERLNKEVPYGLMVETEMVEDKGKKVVIKQVIYIKEERHKPIILGSKGRTIKDIGMTARIAMEEDLGREIHLTLFVKVKKGWDHSAQVLNSWGLSTD
ncbi:MAG: GTPase Era [Alphaproteobacteria bacterium]|nr:GTPase Era [Alphaproteobacteria bacterium]